MLSPSALRAIIDFLRDAENRLPTGLSKIRVDGELMSRSELADLVQAALVAHAMNKFDPKK